MRIARTVAIASLMLVPLAGLSHASSDDAWATFAKDVKAKCVAAVQGQLIKPVVAVDPTGSEHYGLALVTGALKAAKTQRASFICVYDKKGKTAEIGSELGPDILNVSAAKPAKK